MRQALERYVKLEAEDGREPLYEYHGNRCSLGIVLSHRHFLIGVSLDLWADGEPIALFHFGPLIVGLNFYPDLSEGVKG